MNWPKDTDAAITAFFGARAAETNLVLIDPPYPMVYEQAEGVFIKLKKLRCHGLVAPSLSRILGRIGAEVSEDERYRLALNVFGGIYQPRRMRGSATSWSRHSWGIAIDLAPRQNGLRTPWPSVATMPEAVIEMFEAEGWKSYARSMSRDAMHFQATQ